MPPLFLYWHFVNFSTAVIDDDDVARGSGPHIDSYLFSYTGCDFPGLFFGFAVQANGVFNSITVYNLKMKSGHVDPP
jgi:hypothetical protein